MKFTATLADEADMPSWIRDSILAIDGGQIRGVSPGFQVPARGGERLLPEPGNPGVFIREIEDAVVFEYSLVARPAYSGTDIIARHDAVNGAESTHARGGFPLAITLSTTALLSALRLSDTTEETRRRPAFWRSQLRPFPIIWGTPTRAHPRQFSMNQPSESLDIYLICPTRREGRHSPTRSEIPARARCYFPTKYTEAGWSLGPLRWRLRRPQSALVVTPWWMSKYPDHP